MPAECHSLKRSKKILGASMMFYYFACGSTSTNKKGQGVPAVISPNARSIATSKMALPFTKGKEQRQFAAVGSGCQVKS